MGHGTSTTTTTGHGTPTMAGLKDMDITENETAMNHRDAWTSLRHSALQNNAANKSWPFYVRELPRNLACFTSIITGYRNKPRKPCRIALARQCKPMASILIFLCKNILDRETGDEYDSYSLGKDCPPPGPVKPPVII